MQFLPECRKINAAPTDRFDHAHPVDDAKRARCAQVVGDGLSDARGQPRKLAIGADVRELEDRDGRPVPGGGIGALGGRRCISRGPMVSTGAMKR